MPYPSVISSHGAGRYFAEAFGLQLVAAAEPHPGVLLAAWLLGVALSAAGLVASWQWDLPTGPAIVSAFGAATAAVASFFALKKLSGRGAAQLASAAIALVGLLLAAFPRVEQPWLDALETLAPPVRTAFLTDFERSTRTDALQSVERARAELEQLRGLEQDVRWGRKALDPEKLERLRQYIAGRSEMAAGEELVLQHLRSKARERQRLMLGVPLLVLGATGLYCVSRRRRHSP